MSRPGFSVDDRVIFVGHAEHSPPPVVAGREGELSGRVTEDKGAGLYSVALEDAAGSDYPIVQLHGDQMIGV